MTAEQGPHVFRAWVDANDVGNTCCLKPRAHPIHVIPPAQTDWPNLWEVAWKGKLYDETSRHELRRLLGFYDDTVITSRAARPSEPDK